MAKKRRIKHPAVLMIATLLVILAGIAYYFYVAKPADRDTLRVYFLKGDQLYKVERKVLPDESALMKAGFYLTQGPTADEKSQGIYSEMPRGTHVVKSYRKGATAFVDFDSALEGNSGGAARVQALVGQIVYTYTDLPGIEKVKIMVNGRSEVVLGGEGLVIDSPLSRADVKF